MDTELNLSGPTVTVFGDRDRLATALSAELGRRGCSTHTVTTPTGWLTSASHAIVRVDSGAGARAVDDLAQPGLPAAHIVVVCETSSDEAIAATLATQCRELGEHHDISMIWHAPFTDPADASSPDPADLADLAAAIIDLVEHQSSAPSFTSAAFEPHGDPA